MTQLVTLIDGIQAQLDTLRELVSPRDRQTEENNLKTGFPALKARYTTKQAIAAKAQIEIAYENGVIDYDKKRGLKMLVTKRTTGWSPNAV